MATRVLSMRDLERIAAGVDDEGGGERKKRRKSVASSSGGGGGTRRRIARGSAKGAYGGSLYQCRYCANVYDTYAEAKEHEKGKHGDGGKPVKVRAPHRAITAKCKKCGRIHGRGEHASHGFGSFDRTH